MGAEVKKSLAIGSIDDPSESLSIHISFCAIIGSEVGFMVVFLLLCVCHRYPIHAVSDHDRHACEEALCVCL